jgi:hypothetical protein
MPGKLDHASVVAYRVGGELPAENNYSYKCHDEFSSNLNGHPSKKNHN